MSAEAKWRVGAEAKNTIWFGEDVCHGMVTSASIAERICHAMNRAGGATPEAPTAPNELRACWCFNCINAPELGLENPAMRTFVVCPACGNKRCPRATDHRLACTGSNEPGQWGSRYGIELVEGGEGPEITWTDVGDTGDSVGHCACCGEERDEPHTWQECAERSAREAERWNGIAHDPAHARQVLAVAEMPPGEGLISGSEFVDKATAILGGADLPEEENAFTPAIELGRREGRNRTIAQVLAWLDETLSFQEKTSTGEWDDAKLEATKDIRTDLANGIWKREAAEVSRTTSTTCEQLPGWTCTNTPACGVFNGEAKERRSTCRTCGAARPASDPDWGDRESLGRASVEAWKRRWPTDAEQKAWKDGYETGHALGAIEGPEVDASAGDFSWIKVKRFVDDPTKTWEERFRALEKHHAAETTFLIAEVEKLRGAGTNEAPAIDPCASCLGTGHATPVKDGPLEGCLLETERSAVLSAFRKIAALVPHDSAVYQLAAEHASLVAHEQPTQEAMPGLLLMIKGAPSQSYLGPSELVIDDETSVVYSHEKNGGWRLVVENGALRSDKANLRLDIRFGLVDEICTWLASKGHKPAADLLYEGREAFLLNDAKAASGESDDNDVTAAALESAIALAEEGWSYAGKFDREKWQSEARANALRKIAKVADDEPLPTAWATRVLAERAEAAKVQP